MVGCGCIGEDHEPDERAFDTPLGAHQRTQTQRDVADILEFGSPQGEDHEAGMRQSVVNTRLRARIRDLEQHIDKMHERIAFLSSREDVEWLVEARESMSVRQQRESWRSPQEVVVLEPGEWAELDAAMSALAEFARPAAGESNEGGNQNDERRP